MSFIQFLFFQLMGTTFLCISATPSQQQFHSNKPVPCNGDCCINFVKLWELCIECPLGKFGTNCTDNCPNNSYGSLCQERCNCSALFFCSSIYGCIPLPVEGCPEGKHGPECMENCDPGYYGKNCTLQCDCKDEQYCNSEKGCQDFNTSGIECPSCDREEEIKRSKFHDMISSKNIQTFRTYPTMTYSTEDLLYAKNNREDANTEKCLWINRNAIPIVTVLSIIAFGSLSFAIMLAKRNCKIKPYKHQSRQPCATSNIPQKGFDTGNREPSSLVVFNCNYSSFQNVSNQQFMGVMEEDIMNDVLSDTLSKCDSSHYLSILNGTKAEDIVLERQYEIPLQMDEVCQPYASVGYGSLSAKNVEINTTRDIQTYTLDADSFEGYYEEICIKNER